MAKHMAKLETGRQVLSRIMSEEDDEEDEDALEAGGAARQDAEQLRQARISAALAGEALALFLSSMHVS